MVDLKKLIEKSKEKNEIPAASKPETTGTTKLKFNFKKQNNSLSTNGKDTTASSVKTPKFSFLSASPSPVKENGSVSVSAENRVEAKPTPTSPPQTVVEPEAIGEIDVSDFVFKEQPEKFSQEAIDKLNGAISILKSCIDDKQQVGQAITIIMKTLQEHEFLKDIMRAHPEHLGLMVRGLRESYGSVIVKKSANKEKRKKNEVELDKTLDILAGLDFGGGS